MSRRLRRDEEGSALVIALVFVTIIGLWLAALLGFAEAGFKASQTVARQRALVYAADGAMDATIRKVGAERACNDIYTAPEANGVAVKVDCQPPLKPTSHDQFLNPSRAFEIGESPVALTADATLASGAGEQASITLGNYGPPAVTTPVGPAKLKVAHRESGDVERLQLVVRTGTGQSVTVDSVTPCPPAGALCLHSDLRTDEIEVSLPALVDVTVTYTAWLSGGAGRAGTGSLDGIWLEVTAGLPTPQMLVLKPGPRPAGAADPGSPGHDQFADPTNAFQIEPPGSAPAVAEAVLESPRGGSAASIVLGGYNRLTIPDDASIEAAWLRVAHEEVPASGVKSLRLTIEASPRLGASVGSRIELSSTDSPCRLCVRSGPGEDRIDLKSTGELNDPGQFRSIRITYEVTLADGVNQRVVERLDGIQIDLSYAPQGVPPADPATKPRHAVLTLGSGGTEPGLHHGPLAGVVRGGAHSNSSIQVDAPGRLVVQGDATATGSCTGPVEATLTTTCSGAPAVSDPGYPALIGELPARPPPAPACPSGSAWLVSLAPGYYDDVAPLNALTAGGCAGKVVHLLPGAYYFNFNFAGRAADPAASPCGAACTWTISGDVHVVGGEPRGWDPSAGVKPSMPFPGACDLDRTGVQLIFGGESRLHVSGGAVELCPAAGLGPGADTNLRQRIALHGLRDTDPTERATLAPTGHDQFTDADGALAAGGPAATARLSSGRAAAAAIGVGGFPTPVMLPVEPLTRVTLRVTHREVGDVAGLKAVVSTDRGTQEFAVAARSTMGTDQFDVDLAGPTGVRDPAVWPGLRVRWEATLAGGSGRHATVLLDAVDFEVQRSIGSLPLGPVQLTAQVLRPTVHDQFADADGALAAESPARSATATLRPGAPAAAMVLNGFDQVALPAGLTVTKARLRVAHRETAGVALTVGLAGAETALPARTSPGVDELDLKAPPFNLTDTTPLAATAVRWRAALGTATAPATAEIDWVSLEVTYQPAVPLGPARLAATGHDQFADPASALKIDGTVAAAALGTGRAATAAVAVRGFGPAVPSGQTVTGAVLRIAHREGGDVAALRAVVRPPGGPETTVDSGACGPGALCLRSTLAEDRIPIGGLTAAQLAGVEVRFIATLAAGPARDATADLDGIAFEVTHTGPGGTATVTMEPSAHDQFSAAGSAFATDGTVATATLPGGGATGTVAVAMTGYNQFGFPADALIDAVTLRVAHRQSGTAGVTAVRATVNGGGVTCTPTLPARSTLGEDAVDLKACGFNRPEHLRGLTVGYEVTGHSATVDLDGAVIEVAYRSPRLERLTGCSTTRPYGALNACAVLLADGPAALAVHGTVYAPTAAVDLRVTGPKGLGVGHPVLDRGVVARTVHLAIPAADRYEGPVVMVPDDVDKAQMTRIFTAYTDDGGRIDELLRALVRYDPLGSQPVEILGWSVLV